MKYKMEDREINYKLNKLVDAYNNIANVTNWNINVAESIFCSYNEFIIMFFVILLCLTCAVWCDADTVEKEKKGFLS